MSEVIRWKLKGVIPGVEGMSKALFQPWVVTAEDYDAALAKIAALQLLLNTADQRNADLQAELDARRKNAARYQWLRSVSTGPFLIQQHLYETISDDCNPPYRAMKCEKDLDDAIDAILGQGVPA